MIEIFNQGSIDATSIEIADVYQAGLYFSDSFNSDWIVKGDQLEYVPTLDLMAGQTDSVYIKMIVLPDANNLNLIK